MPESLKQEQKEEAQEKKEIIAPDYTTEELEERAELIRAMCLARDNRESPHPEFDDMTYSQYYDSNKRADLAYIPPKKNKQDKRIVTGYTREKDTTLLSALLGYNFQPDITVYNNSELIIAELGNNMEDVVKKTREIEDWNTKRSLVYRELISQGDVFVEEIWEVQRIPDIENKNNWKPGMKIKDAQFEEKPVSRKFERAAVRLHQGKNVYLGDFWLDDYDQQSLVFTYEVMSRERAKSIYGTWDRWENVPYQVDNTVLLDNMGQTYNTWSLIAVQNNQVGVLKIQRPFCNSYQIMLNGVMMLPCDYPLSAISPDGKPTIKHAGLERINGCAYSKGQPAKTKVDQAVHDNFLRLMILREEQAGAPPMGYSGRRVLSSDIYTPGKINNNMKEGQLFPILPQTTGLNQADFSMYQLIKQQIEDKTINATYSGEAPDTKVTLGQLQMEKQQQLIKLGINFDAVKNLERTLVWGRIGNIILNYAKPLDSKVNDSNPDNKVLENIYRTFSIETTLSNGQAGIKQFEFTDKPFPTVREQQQEEEQLGDYYGKPVQKVYFNSEAFMNLLKYRWIVNIVATQEDSDDIEREQFVGYVREAKEIFGPDAVNDSYAKEKYAIKIGEDPTKFFVPQEQLDQARMAAGQVDAMGKPIAGMPVKSTPSSNPRERVPAR